ncbi:MAG: type I methionyl aminopeptidase [Candidatus Omnitrophica bacterium CG11_big_fil_rev_8_21_14_0_20_64_10]|nr:MAG: type I methionyl aminopeptidase [Candidatus Omnitrophica bacterium CG11_big_fil_rev_8_21_14_0_20_64_10]
MIELKNSVQLDKMRSAGRILGQLLEQLGAEVRPGITTQALDEIAERFIRQQGGQPAFKGYRGFPATICASVNEEVVHGIPSDRRLKAGDIVGLDVGAIVEGYYADAARTFPVGEISREARDLIATTEAALNAGIRQARPGNRLGDISHAIQAVAEEGGYAIVRDFVGHGIGTRLHEPPEVPNYGEPGRGPVLEAGWVLAIEPMVNLGGAAVEVLPDGWTAVAKDGKISAHFEQTVAVTPQGPEILTECPKKKPYK